MAAEVTAEVPDVAAAAADEAAIEVEEIEVAETRGGAPSTLPTPPTACAISTTSTVIKVSTVLHR